jgi:hypothetical protein
LGSAVISAAAVVKQPVRPYVHLRGYDNVWIDHLQTQ